MVERTMTNDKKELFKNRLMRTFNPDHNDKFNKTNFEMVNNYNQRHFYNPNLSIHLDTRSRLKNQIKKQKT